MWLVEVYAPSTLPPLLQMGMHDVFLCLFFLSGRVILGRGVSWSTSRVWGRVALFGATLSTLPAAVFAASKGQVSKFTEVLVAAAIPVIVVFVEAQRADGFGADRSPMRFLGPALAGLGGMALLLPFTFPGSVAGKMWLVMLVVSAVLAGYSAVRLHHLLPSFSRLIFFEVAFIVSGASAALLMASCWFAGVAGVRLDLRTLANELFRCLLLDVPILWLTVWLLKAMRPVRFASRYFLAPLLTVIEGFLVLRPEVTWTLAFGASLLLSAGVLLLMAD